MKIIFSPMRRDETLELARLGDSLVMNGDVFDFSSLADGDFLPANAIGCSWITGEVRREAGVLHVQIILPHGADAPQETLFPGMLSVTEDGPVSLPSHHIEPPAENILDF